MPLSLVEAKRAQLFEQMFHLVAKIPESRKKFGNQFYYSHTQDLKDIENSNRNPATKRVDNMDDATSR